MDKEKMMYEKIKFIEQNKERLKHDILTKVDYKDEKDTILLLLFLLLMSDEELKETEEFKSIIPLCIENKIDTITQLSDIFGMIKMYIYKIYCGTIVCTEYINKMEAYEILIQKMYSKKIQTYQKVLVY